MCFCLDPVEEAADRLGLLFTLLLTVVAFMFICTTGEYSIMADGACLKIVTDLT